MTPGSVSVLVLLFAVGLAVLVGVAMALFESRRNARTHSPAASEIPERREFGQRAA